MTVVVQPCSYGLRNPGENMCFLNAGAQVIAAPQLCIDRARWSFLTAFTAVHRLQSILNLKPEFATSILEYDHPACPGMHGLCLSVLYQRGSSWFSE